MQLPPTSSIVKILMIGILAATAVLGTPKPILAFNLDGSVVSPTPVRWRSGTKIAYTPGGVGLEMNGMLSGWMLNDHPAFVLQKAITISAWLKPSAYVTSGPGAQILFRGDDRGGLDPYSLVIHPDGLVYFNFQDPRNNNVSVSSVEQIKLNFWTHVMATFDASKQEVRMFINGKLVKSTPTKGLIPIRSIDPQYASGVGVGNIQWDKGQHNQPFNGIIADLRLYNVALEPKDVGYNPEGWLYWGE